MESNRRRQPEFCFLNTTHPSDATSLESLSQIRSHVARDIHARARQSGLRRRKKSAGKSLKAGETGLAVHADATRAPRPAAPPPMSLCKTRERGDAPTVIALPSPLGTLSPRRIDPFQSFVRSLSTLEESLVHHFFLLDEIENPGVGCPLSGRARAVLFASRATTDAGLLAALLLRSCRSLVRAQDSQELARHCLQYRGECIESIKISLAVDDIGDATVMKIMVLAADHWLAGHFDGWKVHSNAVARIVKLRGGFDDLEHGSVVKRIITEKPTIFPPLVQ
ncbi:hypothetical protein GQ53DRAFT_227538 [Thozetella sp. PMI_491]|nr:hypothetical protein GQ53DRAFT_227538 [Thozetella sp. PMI_491]